MTASVHPNACANFTTRKTFLSVFSWLDDSSMTGWHCVSPPITFNLTASFPFVKYITLFLISWWCFECVLQSSNRRSIRSYLLTPMERHFLNCFHNFLPILVAVTLIEPLVACRFLSNNLIEAYQCWSLVKNKFEIGLLVIWVTIKFYRQPNIFKLLCSC